MDGSPAIRSARGAGRRCLQTGSGCSRCAGEDLVLLPTGAGAMVTLPKGDVVRVGDGGWLRDSKRIVFTGHSGDNTPRGYIQEIPAGIPRAITPPGVVLAGRAAARDDDSILGRVGATWTLFPIRGGDGRPLRALMPGDIPLQWSHDGRYVYTVDQRRRGAAGSRGCLSRGGGDAAPDALEDSHAVRPRGSRGHARNSRHHPGRAVVLLLLLATARRPVRGRWAEVSQLTAG